LTKEDRILEWFQFAMLVAAAFMAAKVAIQLRSRGKVAAAVLWGVFAAGCVVIAGEEIAWGQRLLDVETPEALDQINHQGELTVHNIRGVQDAVNLVFVVAGLFGSAGAAFVRSWFRPAPGSTVDLVTPPLFLVSLFVIVAGYKSARLLVFSEARFVVVKYGEYVEACLAVAFLAFGWYMLRRLRERDAAPEPHG